MRAWLLAVALGLSAACGPEPRELDPEVFSAYNGGPGWGSGFSSRVTPMTEAANRARADGATCGAYDGQSAPEAWQTEHAYPPAGELSVDPRLMGSALAHAQYMAATHDYRHQTPDALAAAGAAAENIGLPGPAIFSTAEGVEVERRPRPDLEVPAQFVAGWLQSPGHCHNLMQARWSRIGTAAALAEDGTWYGVQVFAD